jgi:hypothetical protein
MTLDELAGFHEKQAANFEPFGASNAVTVFHRDAASLIRMKLCAVDSLRSVLIRTGASALRRVVLMQRERSNV